MLKNENIICVSWLVWDSIPLVMHQMMTRLARNNRVLFVDPPVAYSNLIIRPSLWKDRLKKTFLWLRGVRQVNDNMYVYYPPPLLLQYGHYKNADSLNQSFITSAIAKTAKRLGFTNPIVWIYHPYAINPKGEFDEKLVCYDCNDDVGFFFCYHFNKRNRFSDMEERLAKRADVVFATSKYLYRIRKEQNPNTHYLPSGVDSELFQQAQSPACKVAPELEGIPSPIIGFVGGMANSKMNWEWIKTAANSHPWWSFIFVGPYTESPPTYITQQKNISFIGPKPMEKLPSYIKGFDVCLIPYQGEEFLRACQPTKAFEYLASGKPVVASWIPELDDNRNLIRLSRSASEFIQNIEAALADGKKPSMVQRYVEAAQGHTWEERVEKTSQLIESLLK
ncbi:Putative teichuronic acid biosynthesis glycosyltransferase TuaH [Candidatus Brocadiaceae bacterium]|nr:Putative teichuronic acid biosynthesis glycosyltransferase TuaH [Candidatus Brocadiaceae bacterium]